MRRTACAEPHLRARLPALKLGQLLIIELVRYTLGRVHRADVWSEDIINIGDGTYTLVGIVCHDGPSPHLGHYVCWRRMPDNSGWWCCNDGVISSHEQLPDCVASTSYILTYLRCTSDRDRHLVDPEEAALLRKIAVARKRKNDRQLTRSGR